MNTKKSKVRLWSVLTALTAILTIAAIVSNMIANQYATTLNVALNASTYKIIKGNTTEDTEYFKAGFASEEEREAYEAELCATVTVPLPSTSVSTWMSALFSCRAGVIFTPVSPKCPSAMWFLFTTSRLTSR